jgi:hypothetical protein
MPKSETQVFHRVVKAPKGHPFAGLYAVEEVYVKNNEIVEKTIVHEWDLRILSEAALARLGGDSAYKAYTRDNDVVDPLPKIGEEIAARTKEDLKELTQRKLNKELRGE